MSGGIGSFKDLLDRVKLIRFPPIVVFLFVFPYGLFGAYIIHSKETKWSYTESLYFTFISILTVGSFFFLHIIWPDSKSIGSNFSVYSKVPQQRHEDI